MRPFIWLGDSQRVAYFNQSRELHATSVYFRKGTAFVEISLPEFPGVTRSKTDPKDLKTIFYTVTPKYWLESGALFLSISGDWERVRARTSIASKTSRSGSMPTTRFGPKAEKTPEPSVEELITKRNFLRRRTKRAGER